MHLLGVLPGWWVMRLLDDSVLLGPCGRVPLRWESLGACACGASSPGVDFPLCSAWRQVSFLGAGPGGLLLTQSCPEALLFSRQVVSNSFATPKTVGRQAPLSFGSSRQEYWSGLPFPPPADLSDPGIEPAFLVSPALTGRFFATVPPGQSQDLVNYVRPVIEG